jgi:hypothetical protein
VVWPLVFNVVKMGVDSFMKPTKPATELELGDDEPWRSTGVTTQVLVASGVPGLEMPLQRVVGWCVKTPCFEK